MRSSAPHHARRSRPRWGVLLLGGVSVVCLALAGVLGAAAWVGERNGAGLPQDLRGNSVRYEAGASLPAAETARMRASDDDGQRFRVPSVGLDVSLGSLNEVDGTIVPPGFRSAYWVRNRGVSVSRAVDGTVYVVMHAIRHGVGPGNLLTDISAETSRVSPGALIEVAGTTYRVTGSSLVKKPDLPSSSWVWQSVPDRLIVVTCMERPHGESLQNLVITAVR